MSTSTKTRIIKKFTIKSVKEGSYKYESVSPVTSKENVRDFLRSNFSDHCYEYFIILALDGRNRIIGVNVMEGTTNQCVVFTKKVFSFLLSSGANSFIVSHNHPGGSIIPSDQDWDTTHKLHRIGKDIEIPLLDHLIITETEEVSLVELPKWPI